MPPPNKNSKLLGDDRDNYLIRKQKQTAIKRTKERRRDAWAVMLDILKENSDILINTQGRVLTLEENKVVLLILYRDLEIALSQCTTDGNIYGTGLTEHKFFRQTSATLRMDSKEVRQLYYSFTSKQTGIILDIIRLVYDNALRGKGRTNSKLHGKISNSLHLHLIKYIDMKHAEGKKVACRKILNWLPKKHAAYCSKNTFSRAMLGISLSYKQSKKNCTEITLHVLTKSETT